MLLNRLTKNMVSWIAINIQNTLSSFVLYSFKFKFKFYIKIMHIRQIIVEMSRGNVPSPIFHTPYRHFNKCKQFNFNICSACHACSIKNKYTPKLNTSNFNYSTLNHPRSNDNLSMLKIKCVPRL